MRLCEGRNTAIVGVVLPEQTTELGRNAPHIRADDLQTMIVRVDFPHRRRTEGRHFTCAVAV